MKFKLTFSGRQSGALGISHRIKTTCESNIDLTQLTQEELYHHPACFSLWEKWEHIQDLRAEKITTMLDDFGDEVTEARILPTGGGSNIICGISGYQQEMQFRRERNKELSKTAKFALPAWETLKVYFPAQNGGKV